MASAGRNQGKSKVVKGAQFVQALRLLTLHLWNSDRIRASTLEGIDEFQGMTRFNAGNFLVDAAGKGYVTSVSKGRSGYRVNRENDQMRKLAIELDVLPGPQRARELVEQVHGDEERELVTHEFAEILSSGNPLPAGAFDAKMRELFGWKDGEQEVPGYLIEMVLIQLTEGENPLMKMKAMSGGVKGFILAHQPEKQPDPPAGGSTDDGDSMEHSAADKKSLWLKEDETRPDLLVLLIGMAINQSAQAKEDREQGIPRKRLYDGAAEIWQHIAEGDALPSAKMLGYAIGDMDRWEKPLLFRTSTSYARIGLTQLGWERYETLEAERAKPDDTPPPPPESPIPPSGDIDLATLLAQQSELERRIAQKMERDAEALVSSILGAINELLPETVPGGRKALAGMVIEKLTEQVAE